MTDTRVLPAVKEERIEIDRYGKLVLTRVFTDPDGEDRDFLLWGGKTNAVIILPVTPEKEVIAIEVFRRAANELVTEVSGGSLDDNEGIENCACRELLDETGYTLGRILILGEKVWFDPASCFTSFIPVLALDCQKNQEQSLEETEKNESMKVRLFSIPDWLNMIYSGEIHDSKTIATTFLALPHLGYGF